MPELLFTWALDNTRRVHYEFLDNSVDEGHPPRPVAHGWNREMTILDIKRILDIDRFRKINIHARGPDEVYFGKELPAERNVGFMKRCVRLIPTINFADHKTGRIYARLERGSWSWRDEEQFARSLEDADDRAGLSVIQAKGNDTAGEAPDVLTNLEEQNTHSGRLGSPDDGLLRYPSNAIAPCHVTIEARSSDQL